MSGDTATPVICPVCGLPKPSDKHRGNVCVPSRCPTWETQAVYDHAQHKWLPTDLDGRVLDGRLIEEVQ